MDYGSLIREAWAITSRHRFLWILGLFAASSVGSCNPTGTSSYQVSAGDTDSFRGLPPEAARIMEELGRWVVANVALIGLVAVLFFLVGLAFMVVSLIAQGGMARATADLATGQPSSLGTAWRAGLRYFWRYLGLWLLLLLVVIAIAIAVGIFVGIFIGLISLFTDGGPRLLVAVVGGLLAVVGVLGAIVLAILGSIVVAYAQRAIAVEDVGPLAALQSGIELLRANLGTSLLVWLVNVALGIGAGIAIAIAAVVAIVVIGAVGALVWAIAGLTAPTIVYAVFGLLVFIAVLWGIGGVVNTYFWNYWTIAYLRLTGRVQPAPQA